MSYYLARRDKLRQRLKAEGMTALLITNFTNVSYLSGFSGDDSFLLVHPQGDLIISDGRYRTQIEEECPGLESLIRPGSLSLFDAVAKIVGGFRGASLRIGVEADSITVAQRDKLAEKLPKWDVAPTCGRVEDLRMIKDKREIERIRTAIRCAHRGLDLLRCSLQEDQTEIELRNELEYAMRKFGADDKSFPSILAVGERAALPHAVPTSKAVRESELLLIDWGAKCEGYISDLTRTWITKKPSPKLRKVYATVLKAQKKAIEAIRPEEISGNIDRIARSIIEDAGFGKAFSHGLGHGIGLQVHENIRLSQGNKAVLQPGMVLTVEPGIYLPGWGGVRIEDDILVTKSGYENLSANVPKEFEEMIIG